MTRVTPILAATETLERRLEFARLPEGWASVGSVVLLLVLLYAAILLYRREHRAGATRRMRILLAGMRCGLILLLAVVWLEPILATYVHRTVDSLTLVLVDGSASMSLQDRYPQAGDAERVEQALAPTGEELPLTRAAIAQALLAGGDRKLLDRLAENNPVAVYQFGETLSALGRITGSEEEGERGGGGEGEIMVFKSFSPTPPPPLSESATQPGDADPAADRRALSAITEARQPVTDIGQAVRQAIESHAGTPIAAVVVLSDGRFNRGEPAEVVARYARGKKIPLHAVGIGDPAPPRNVAVTAVEAPPNVFVKDPFQVVAHLRAEGLDADTINVELYEQYEGETGPTLADAKPARVEADGRIEPVTFSRNIGKAAEVQLIVRVASQPAENILDENEKRTAVRALDDKLRVLLVAGDPGWEYRYLSRLLERDATMDVSCWLQSADEDAARDGNTVIEHFPYEQQELFQYDCIILLDAQPTGIDPGWTTHVEALVGSYGGGLLLAAGRANTPRFMHDPNTQSLIDLLPVEIEPRESDLIILELGHFQETDWPLVVPPEARNHPVLAMSEQPGENAQIWARLPGVYWHYPVRREKPVATVLLRHSNPRMRNIHGGHVLLATQFFGSGRTGFVAYDQTWRWRRLGQAYFDRFWVQLIRHLVAGKLMSGQKRGLIQPERDHYAVGESVIIEARLLDAQHLPMTRETVDASLRVEGGLADAFALKAQANRPGWYRGQFIARRTGRHSIQIDLPGGNGTEPATLRSEVEVGQPDLEFRQPQLDRAALETLATQSAGGEYLNVDEADRLCSLIPSRRSTLVLTGQPIHLWDRGWTLGLLVGLLGLEWLLRKRARLL